jgi:hypothetical protein
VTRCGTRLIAVRDPTDTSCDASWPPPAKCEVLYTEFFRKVPTSSSSSVYKCISRHSKSIHRLHRYISFRAFSSLSPKRRLSRTKPVAGLDQDRIPNIHLLFHVLLRFVGRILDAGDICVGSSEHVGRCCASGSPWCTYLL